MPYYVYILVSEVDGTLYMGQTEDLKGRFRRHNKGLVQTTRNHAPYKLGYFEVVESRSEAMWREWELKKKWNTQRKKKLVDKFDQSLVDALLRQ